MIFRPWSCLTAAIAVTLVAGCGGTTAVVTRTVVRTESVPITTVRGFPTVFVPTRSGPPLYRPYRIVTAGYGSIILPGSIIRLRWRSYGRNYARASATIRVCRQTCEHTRYVSADVTLGPVVACGSTPIYSRLEVTASKDEVLVATILDLRELCIQAAR